MSFGGNGFNSSSGNTKLALTSVNFGKLLMKSQGLYYGTNLILDGSTGLLPPLVDASNGLSASLTSASASLSSQITDGLSSVSSTLSSQIQAVNAALLGTLTLSISDQDSKRQADYTDLTNIQNSDFEELSNQIDTLGSKHSS